MLSAGLGGGVVAGITRSRGLHHYSFESELLVLCVELFNG